MSNFFSDIILNDPKLSKHKTGTIDNIEFKIKARRIRWIEKDSIFRLTNYKKRSFKIIIGDFYSLKSASSLRNNLLNNLTDFPKNKLTIKTINSKSHILSSGPYSTINLLKNDYIKIINFGFEDLDVKLYE